LLVLLLAAALRAIAVAAVAAAITTVAALVAVVAIAAGVALVAAARVLRPRRGLRRNGGFAAAEEAEDAVPQAHAAGLHRSHRLRDRGFLARLAHGRRLRRTHVGHRGDGRHVEVGLGQRDGRQLARAAALVAGLAGLFAQLVLADAGDLEVRRVQLVVGDDHDRRVVALLDLRQRTALLVEQVVGDLDRGLHQDLPGVVLHRVLFGQADDRQRQRFDAAHAAVAFATRAHDLA